MSTSHGYITRALEQRMEVKDPSDPDGKMPASRNGGEKVVTDPGEPPCPYLWMLNSSAKWVWDFKAPEK